MASSHIVRFTVRRAGTLLLATVIAMAGCSSDAPGASSDATGAEPVCGATPFRGCTESEFTGDGATVAIIGDSITNLSRDQLHEALDGYSVRISGIGGATVKSQQSAADL